MRTSNWKLSRAFWPLREAFFPRSKGSIKAVVPFFFLSSLIERTVKLHVPLPWRKKQVGLFIILWQRSLFSLEKGKKGGVSVCVHWVVSHTQMPRDYANGRKALGLVLFSTHTHTACLQHNTCNDPKMPYAKFMALLSSFDRKEGKGTCISFILASRTQRILS